MKSYFLLLLVLLFTVAATAQPGAIDKKTLTVRLGETSVKINVYEKAGTNVTFFAPHRNEQTAIRLAKEFLAQKGGRLVELESFDAGGNPARRTAFNFKGKAFALDPNRIYTANGRRCTGFSGEVERAVEAFAAKILEVVFDDDRSRLSSGEKIVVAVHNNTDSRRGAGDLTATAFAAQTRTGAQAAFEAQAAGVFLANAEADADNFVFLSSTRYVGFFAQAGFNVVVQKPKAALFSDQCAIDDGSLSVYSGQQEDVEYICLEADAATGAARQRQMFEAVYRLLGKTGENDPAKS